MPRLIPAPAVPVPSFIDDDGEDSFGDRPPIPRDDSDERTMAKLKAKALKTFVPKAFTWPPETVDGRCISGSLVLKGLSGRDTGAIRGAQQGAYCPPRVGCGTAEQDCAYCASDLTVLLQRVNKVNSNTGLSTGHVLRALEAKIGRTINRWEFNHIIANAGLGCSLESYETSLSNARKRAEEAHASDEERRLRYAVDALFAEVERRRRDAKTRGLNTIRKANALLSAMHCDPAPVNLADGNIQRGLYDRKSPAHGTPFLASRGWKRSHRTVGLEVEFNQLTGLQTWIKRWHGAIHTDGSCGWEAVTTPIAGDRILPCMLELTSTLKKANAGADSRCSVHVHVDASDVTWACMRRLLRVYAIVEPLLYAIGGQHRARCRWAAPCGVAYSEAARCEDFKEAVLWVALSGATTGMKGKERMRTGVQKKDGGRYRGLNILPWVAGRKVNAPDTTIEFRIHRNSLDGKRLAGWASMLASLVDFAVHSSDAEVNALPRSALRTLVKACPEDKDWILSRVQAWRRATTTVSTEEVYDDAGSIVPIRIISARKGWAICAG